MKLVEYMKDHGTRTNGTEKATNDLVTGISIWVTMNTVEYVARVCTLGSVETPTMVNGLME